MKTKHLATMYAIVAAALYAINVPFSKILLQHTHEHSHTHTHEHSHGEMMHTHEHTHTHSHIHTHGEDNNNHDHIHKEMVHEHCHAC